MIPPFTVHFKLSQEVTSFKSASSFRLFSLVLPPFSLLRDFSFQNTSEHFAIRFRQSYLIWEVCDVTAIPFFRYIKIQLGSEA